MDERTIPPVRLGVIGCGAIAQIQHLPNLASLREEFEVVTVCDRSPALAEYVANTFHVQNFTTDYNDLLASDLDALLLCHTDPKTTVAVGAFEAGKHVFMEKPICYSIQDADAIIAAARQSGKVGLVGYVKVYDPAFELAKREADEMDDIRFVQINHLHPNNKLHLSQYRIKRFDDLSPRESVEGKGEKRKSLQAIGDVPSHVEQAFFTVSGSMIHDLYGLHILLGEPKAVISTEIWNDGRAINTVLEYPTGTRCVATWVDLPKLWDFKETLEVYGDDKRVILSYPTGFARGIPTNITVQEIDGSGRSFRKEPAVSWDGAFTQELRHFHECIVRGTPPRTPVDDARSDISLIIEIIMAYQRRYQS